MSTESSLQGAYDTRSAAALELGKEVNCLNIKVVYDFVMNKLPTRAHQLFDNLPEPYSQLSNPAVQLTDENNWVSSEIIVRIFENAKRILNDPEAPYEIGFDSIAQRSFGYIQKLFVVTFGSPVGILKRINHVNSQFNTTKVVETIYSSPQRAVVRLHWKQNRALSADICRFNRGIYAAIPTIFNQQPATITEPFCQFEGDPYCQFNITFHTKRRSLKSLFGVFATKKSQLLSALEQIERDKQVLKNKYDEVNTLNIELADKVEKLKAVNTASTLVVSQENTDEILTTTMNFIVSTFQFDRAIVLLADEEHTKLEFKYAAGADPKEIEEHLRGYTIPLTGHINVLARVAKRGKPTIVRDVNEAGLRKGNPILANFDVQSFVMCPLTASEGMIGILAADRHRSQKTIEERDMQDLAIFANTIAETLHKARLREEIQSSYLSTVRALVQTVEEKDAYTRGHSERVADLSVRIAAQMGLPERERELLRIGCLLHDVGKIGVSEAIVRSPKPLSKSEFNKMKEHPIKGAEIVRPIRFIQNHIHVIRNHHERYDGMGYPDGLAGDEIPITAQIACVADAFDAMTSTRPYRKGIKAEDAVRQIVDQRGRQFGPIAVDAFKSVMERKAGR